MGLSSLLHKGHVIYLPASGDTEEKFLHSGHVRTGLVDPGLPDVHLHVADSPRRRIVDKKPMEVVEMKRVGLEPEEVHEMATMGAKKLLDVWDHDEARSMVVDLAERGFFDEVKFGVFRHGGTVGWLKGFDQYPDLSRLLARLVLEVDPTATFTPIWVSHNSMRPLHQDLNNDVWTNNYVIPLLLPASGGELWTELSPGDRVCGPITMRAGPGGREVYGQLHSLEVGSCIKFNPRRFHEVQEWKGSRTVLVAYTPQCLGKLDYKDIQALDEHGFPPPLSQLPEAFWRSTSSLPWQDSPTW